MADTPFPVPVPVPVPVPARCAMTDFNNLLAHFAAALSARFPDNASLAALPQLVSAALFFDRRVPAMEFGNAQDPFMLRIRDCIRRRDPALFLDRGMASQWPLLRQLDFSTIWTPDLDTQTKDSMWQYFEGMDRLADAAAAVAFKMPEPATDRDNMAQEALDSIQGKMASMSSDQVAGVAKDTLKWVSLIVSHPLLADYDFKAVFVAASETPSGQRLMPLFVRLQEECEEIVPEGDEEGGQSGAMSSASMDKIKALVNDVGVDNLQAWCNGSLDELGGFPGVLTILTGSQQKAAQLLQNPASILHKLQTVAKDVMARLETTTTEEDGGQGAGGGLGEQNSESTNGLIAWMKDAFEKYKDMLPPQVLPFLAGFGIDVGDPAAKKSALAFAGRAAASMMNIPEPQMARGRLKGKARAEAKKKQAGERKLL